MYTYPVGDLATSLGVRWQPDPGGFSFCLGVPIQVAGQRIQNKFPPFPWKGTGGIMKEEKKEVPRLKGKEFKFFPFFHRGGRGGLQSVRLGTGGWFRPLPRGTRQARKKGK